VIFEKEYIMRCSSSVRTVIRLSALGWCHRGVGR